MATMTHDQTVSLGHARSEGWLGLSRRFSDWNERRRQIARITRELNTYTDRQLADLGLCRSDIHDVARGVITR